MINDKKGAVAQANKKDDQSVHQMIAITAASLKMAKDIGHMSTRRLDCVLFVVIYSLH